MRKPLRVLAFSDVHGDVSRIQQLKQKALEENVDIVIICGDFTAPNEEIPEGLIGSFLELKKEVFLVRGNHESESTGNFLADVYKIKHLEGDGVVVNDVGIFGCSAANLGVFSLDESEIFDRLRQGHGRIDGALHKLMVTHVHPSDSDMERNFFPGSSGVRQAIRQFRPEIALCGHIHEAEGMEEMIEGTRVMNVSKSGKVFEI